MSVQYSLDDINLAIKQAITSIFNYYNSLNLTVDENVKLSCSYFKWIAHKTALIRDEHPFKIPPSALPDFLELSIVDWLTQEKRSFVLQYYTMDTTHSKYILSVDKTAVPNPDIHFIMQYTVLIKRTVVWVDFGHNIGREFGGRHPAIILKNLKDSLLVIPLSSQTPNNMKYNVKINKVYGYKPIPRWVNVTRIEQISLSRVQFSNYGTISAADLNNIHKKLYCVFDLHKTTNEF